MPSTRPCPIFQSKMARWPKEQPATWYSQFKRGSLVSARRRPLASAWDPRPPRRGCTCSRRSGRTAPRHATAGQGTARPATPRPFPSAREQAAVPVLQGTGGVQGPEPPLPGRRSPAASGGLCPARSFFYFFYSLLSVSCSVLGAGPRSLDPWDLSRARPLGLAQPEGRSDGGAGPGRLGCSPGGSVSVCSDSW